MIMFFKALSAFIALYFIHGAFIFWQRAFVQICRKALYNSAFTYHSTFTQFIQVQASAYFLFF
jgi:hypothetical protein